MSRFDDFIERVLVHEGGYSNDPRDAGGETHWGISKRAYPHLDIRNLTRKEAIDMYRRDYWRALQCDKMPAAVAFQVLDAAINHGRGNAARWLQRAVHVADDGIIGKVTLAAVGEWEVMRVIVAFNAQRLDFYTRLQSFPVFGRGWVKRVAVNMGHAVQDAKEKEG